jgi:hypothetical protein
MIRITLPKNFYRAFAADDVDQMANAIVKNVIRVTHRGQCGNDSPRICV